MVPAIAPHHHEWIKCEGHISHKLPPHSMAISLAIFGVTMGPKIKYLESKTQ